jgi:putative transposase
MKDLALIVIHILATTAKLLGPGGLRAVVTENTLLRHQPVVLRRSRRRAPNLTTLDRFLFGFGLLFLRPGRVSKIAVGLRPSTFLKFHQALVRRKYHRLFSSRHHARKPGPKGPGDELIRAIVELNCVILASAA